jgi:predicted Zn-ribbon and HTH transcriptional regulator
MWLFVRVVKGSHLGPPSVGTKKRRTVNPSSSIALFTADNMPPERVPVFCASLGVSKCSRFNYDNSEVHDETEARDDMILLVVCENCGLGYNLERWPDYCPRCQSVRREGFDPSREVYQRTRKEHPRE